jgi:F0F1-type ATP synthase delta subunit
MWLSIRFKKPREYEEIERTVRKKISEITPDVLDLNKTKVVYIYENTELTRTQLKTLYVTLVPSFQSNTKIKYSIDSSKQAKGEILITITSQFASKYAIVDKYFPE